jgi:hypothetical protein
MNRGLNRSLLLTRGLNRVAGSRGQTVLLSFTSKDLGHARKKNIIEHAFIA